MDYSYRRVLILPVSPELNIRDSMSIRATVDYREIDNRIVVWSDVIWLSDITDRNKSCRQLPRHRKTDGMRSGIFAVRANNTMVHHGFTAPVLTQSEISPDGASAVARPEITGPGGWVSRSGRICPA